jgi:hypothetical protein
MVTYSSHQVWDHVQQMYDQNLDYVQPLHVLLMLLVLREMIGDGGDGMGRQERREFDTFVGGLVTDLVLNLDIRYVALQKRSHLLHEQVFSGGRILTKVGTCS